MEIDIAKAEAYDLEIILDLQKECYLIEAEIYNDYNIPPLTQDIESLKKEFEVTTILKAIIDKKIIGSIRGYIKNETLYIGKLIVKREYQNQGIGQQLLITMESFFCNYKRSEIFTGFKSLKNLYLYDKLGYKKFNCHKIDNNLTIIFLEKMIANQP